MLFVESVKRTAQRLVKNSASEVLNSGQVNLVLAHESLNKIMERSGARSVVVDVTIRTFERLVRHGASWASPFLEEGITKRFDLLVDDESAGTGEALQRGLATLGAEGWIGRLAPPCTTCRTRR